MSSLLEKSSKARSMRDKVVGVRSIPDDAFAADRDRLVKFDSAIRAVEGTSSRTQNSFSKLVTARQRAVGAANTSTSELDTASENSQAKLQATSMRVSGLKSQCANIEASLKERDRLYWDKVHYEDKVANLTDEDKLKSDLVDRNVKKRSNAITAFAETEKAHRDAQAFASTMDLAVSDLVNQYIGGLQEFFKHSQRQREN